MSGVATATGMNSHFGKTAHLVEQARAVPHFRWAVPRIGNFLILVTIGWGLLIGLAAYALVSFVVASGVKFAVYPSFDHCAARQAHHLA